MYAVITRPIFWEDIENAINMKEGNILFKNVDNNIDIFDVMEKISRLPINKLIIDIDCIYDKNKISQAIRNFRIKKDDSVRIIIIAPDFIPGNELISSLVTIGIKDILNPMINDENKYNIQNALYECLENPFTYSRAVKWDIGVIIKPLTQNSQISNIKPIEEKIIGTVVIGVFGSCRGSGSTKTAISTAYYISRIKYNYKVALVEVNKTGDFKKLGISSKNTSANSFKLNGIDFYYNVKVSDIINMGYNYVILDFGVLFELDINGNIFHNEITGHNFTNEEENMREFHRSHVKICACQINPWQTDEALYSMGYGKNFETWKEVSKDFNYYFTLTDNNEFQVFKDKFSEKKMFLAPIFFNLFEINDTLDNITYQMISLILPKKIEFKKTNKLKVILKKTIEVFMFLIFISIVLLVLYYSLRKLKIDPFPYLGDWLNKFLGKTIF